LTAKTLVLIFNLDESITSNEFFSTLASAESGSEHPLGMFKLKTLKNVAHIITQHVLLLSIHKACKMLEFKSLITSKHFQEGASDVTLVIALLPSVTEG